MRSAAARRPAYLARTTLANGRAKAFTVLAALATGAVACGVVYLFFLRGDSGLQRMDAATESEIIQAFDRMVADAEARNVDDLFSHYAENDRGALVLQGRIFLTRGAALERTRENFRDVAAVTYRIAERHVTVLSSGNALLVVAGTVSAKTGEGREFTTPFVQTIVFTRERGEWRVLHAHQSSPR
jgi:ketosteroid isomerase-like protein